MSLFSFEIRSTGPKHTKGNNQDGWTKPCISAALRPNPGAGRPRPGSLILAILILILTFSLQVPTPASTINLDGYSPSGTRYAEVSPEIQWTNQDNFYIYVASNDLEMLEEDNLPPVPDVTPDDFDDEVCSNEVLDLFETPPATRSPFYPPPRPAKRHRGPGPRQ